MSTSSARIPRLSQHLIRPFVAYAGFCKGFHSFYFPKIGLIESSCAPQRYSASIAMATMVQYSQVLLGGFGRQ